ncbi:ISNCY family transposase, partial [Shigella flexneri]
LEMAQLVQAERDNNRSQSVPSGDGTSRRRKAPTTKKSQRSLDQDDMFNALVKLQTRAEEIFGERNQK